jgi:hypothetical protein
VDAKILDEYIASSAAFTTKMEAEYSSEMLTFASKAIHGVTRPKPEHFFILTPEKLCVYYYYY